MQKERKGSRDLEAEEMRGVSPITGTSALNPLRPGSAVGQAHTLPATLGCLLQ